MASDKKVFSSDEVSQHNKRDDCWLIISGKVYDVTHFMDEHPGGDEVFLSSAGKDATFDFEDVGHSEDARELMKDRRSTTLVRSIRLFQQQGHTSHLCKPLKTKTRHQNSLSRFCSSLF
ncbi:hypothetical protein BRARA_C01385 [Brassica rapa]|uniref:BnaA03g12200D protein n=2 Tax=Brassica TaxID=3705 RepID=A0A078ID04_BRANA|nr:hypothetical protein BRARA_C01385 [Brassica rapa]CDY47078.1 BnaA03g12200D [Brassica napus]VDC79586.1 unnamed protein product [Brassica rapa]